MPLAVTNTMLQAAVKVHVLVMTMRTYLCICASTPVVYSGFDVTPAVANAMRKASFKIHVLVVPMEANVIILCCPLGIKMINILLHGMHGCRNMSEAH